MQLITTQIPKGLKCFSCESRQALGRWLIEDGPARYTVCLCKDCMNLPVDMILKGVGGEHEKNS